MSVSEGSGGGKCPVRERRGSDDDASTLNHPGNIGSGMPKTQQRHERDWFAPLLLAALVCFSTF